MSVDRVRFGRQIRLLEIGEAGQERLSATAVDAGGEGHARAIAERYLEAAGVGRAPANGSPRADRAPLEATHALGIADPVARETAEGAMRALLVIREALGVNRGEPA